MLKFLGLGAVVYSLLSSVSVADSKPELFVVDMDASVEDRWGALCEAYKDECINLADSIMSSFPPDVLTDFQNVSMYYYDKYLLEVPFKEEINFFSQCTGLSVMDVMTVNLIYDLTSFCTSIVARDINNNIIHGRNQDYPSYFRQDTIDIQFVSSKQNGKVIYEATTFFGYVGIPTGCRGDGFTITIDARNPGITENIKAIEKGYFPSGWLVRTALTNLTDFDDVIKLFTETKIQAPIYYIVGGLDQSNQGAVVTRSEEEAVNVWYLNESEYKWYLVETNYDNWTPAPTHDDRRDPAIQAMNSVGQENINFDTLYQVLSTPPVLNENTLYTTLMAASNPTAYDTTIRNYTGPATGIKLGH